MREKKLVVLQVIHALHIGGAENVVVKLTRALTAKNIDVHVFCINKAGILGDELREEGYNVISNEGASNSGILFNNRLKKAILELSPDIVHSHGTTALLELGPLYMLNKLPPWVHTYHFGNYPNIKKKYLYAERLFSRFATGLIAVSDFQKQMIIKTHWLGKKPISTIHNGVDEMIFDLSSQDLVEIREELGLQGDDIVVGCIAVFSKQKGISYLLEAAAKIVSSNKRIKFLIVGGGELEDDLKNLAKSLKIENNVIFAGWRNDVLRVMQVFDIFVLPSLWEAFSVVVLEAMSARKPVVLSDVADHKMLIEDGVSGMLVPPKDSPALVNKINYLLENPEKAAIMADRAYQYYTINFTISKMAEKYEKYFRKVTAQ